MKKSEIYKAAQICVLESDLNARDALVVLRELMFREDMERFAEDREKGKA